MTAEEIVSNVRAAKAAFGAKCKKFAGAVTVEILKTALAEEGIPTSARDVYIQGISLEIDLVIPKHGAIAPFGILYEPSQVAAALEVKNCGIFGEDSLEKVREGLNRCHSAGICCAYVTLEERRTYKYAASTECLGFPCFTLSWHKNSGGPIETTEDWPSLVDFLRKCGA